MPKKLFILICVIVLAGLLMSGGYIAGRVVGKQKCLATVDANCEFICGVPVEHCFPDEQETYSIDDEEVSDLAFYRKGG